MRAVIVASLVALPMIAAASPKKPIVWNNRVIDNRVPGEPQKLANISNILYINNCLPNGCTVTPGNDDSRTDRSSIPRFNQGPRTLDAWRWGDDHWQRLVDCVEATFKPFNVQVVTTNPGNTSHHEVMIGGTAVQLRDGMEAGGVAPFIGCGATEDNGLSFVFAGQSNDINYLCGAVAQEAAHVWGLDHELDPDDPMTYLELGSEKRFQNSNPRCGEELSQPRNCQCGGATQNSFAFMRESFGLNPNLMPASVEIAKPIDDRYVAPEFSINATLTSELSMLRGRLVIDGEVIEEWTGTQDLSWKAPPTVKPGRRTVEVSVTDAADRTVTDSITVNVVQSCDGGCPSGFTCISDLCVPGADTPGGLGSSCETNADCVTSQCSSDGTTSLCTGKCDADGSCPSGYACIAEANTCWPESSGGCASSGNAAPPLLLIVLGALFLSRRRR